MNLKEAVRRHRVVAMMAAVLGAAPCLPAAPSARPLEPNVFDWPEAISWRTIFRGVEVADVVLSAPRPLRLHALQIDLAAPGVSVTTNRSNGDKPEETDGYKTSTFLKRRGCQAAVNGAPFWPVHRIEGLPQNVAGLVVADGDLVSPVDEHKRPAIVFRNEGCVAVEKPPIDLAGVETAVGGFSVVLRARQAIADGSVARHPRTAAGVAASGRTLVLLVVDGRQPGYSEGVTTYELGVLLAHFGADDGINLDGGGTTAMAIQGPGGGPRLLNRPIHHGIPGNERIAASHLGVYADTVDDSVE